MTTKDEVSNGTMSERFKSELQQELAKQRERWGYRPHCAACKTALLPERVGEPLCWACANDAKTSTPVTGIRHNATKTRLSLISAWAMDGLAKVLTFGEQKYAAHNWARGLRWSHTIDSLERHLNAIKRGEDIDPESGLPHIDHLQANAMFLSHFFALKAVVEVYRTLDDRWQVPGKAENAAPVPTRTSDLTL